MKAAFPERDVDNGLWQKLEDPEDLQLIYLPLWK